MIAVILADEAQAERASELHALASRYPFVSGSRWSADVAGNTLAKAAAALPAERVAVLKDRGRTRDLEPTVKELVVELV